DAAGRASALTFERSASRLLGAFERTTERGYYTVEVTGGRSDQGKGAAGVFAVNLAPEESEFDTLQAGQFRELLPSATVTLIDASGEAQQLFGAIGHEREVWRPLIFLLFAIIAVEFTLATLSGQKKASGEEQTLVDRIRDFSPGTWVGRMTGAGRQPT